MRIITWNVNALRTVLPYHPWTELSNKTIGGMLDAMNAEIICFQEHKARRDTIDKPMALPPGYDAFFSFPHGKGGYSGTCTYIKQTYAIPLKAEEGITGRMLKVPKGCSGNLKLVWEEEEMIGGYVGEDELEVLGNTDGTEFDLKRLDMEGRAVVLDFGFLIIFNLYCPNETNDTRLPYKLNFLHHLQARITHLISLGKNVIVLGDINVCHRPLDNGEGGIQRNAEEHFDHPARKWFDAWVSPKGGMHDVTREAWPERKGMFTCWNTKLDARPSNYGARIDYILVSEGLLPWVKHSDIQPDVFGSDHCPVYLDLHESILDPITGQPVYLRDLMNQGPRVPLPPHLETLGDESRVFPEPPPFATKWWDEFSGKQRSLMSFFGKKVGGSEVPPPPAKVQKQKVEPRKRERSVEASRPVGTLSPGTTTRPNAEEGPGGLLPPINMSVSSGVMPLTIDDADDRDNTGKNEDGDDDDVILCGNNIDQMPIEVGSSPIEASPVYKRKRESPKTSSATSSTQGAKATKGKSKEKEPSGQTKLSAFFRQPTVSPAAPQSGSKSKKKSLETSPLARPAKHARTVSQSSTGPGRGDEPIEIDDDQTQNEMDDEALAMSMAREEEALMGSSGENKPVTEEIKKSWGSIFAKKVPPKCIVHEVPCKSFVSKVPGSKGKKFWLCSRPVGEGWDNGRSKRPRNEVNHQYRCDFFIWDSAVKQKEDVPLDEEEAGHSADGPNKRLKV